MLNTVLFNETHKYELGQMGFSNVVIGAIEKHIDYEFGDKNPKHKDYYAVENLRWAIQGNADQEISYRESVNNKNQDYFTYDRTLAAGNQRVMVGFDFLPIHKAHLYKPLPVMKNKQKSNIASKNKSFKK